MKPGRKKLIDDDKAVEMWLKGYKPKEIAEHFGVEKTAVHRAVRKYKLDHPDFVPPIECIEKEVIEIDKGKVGALYKAHWSVDEIAHEFFVSTKVVEIVLEMEGLK